jgi:hypothetical protein
MTKNLFLTFAGGRRGFKYASLRLGKEVYHSGWESDQLVLNRKSGLRLIGKEWVEHQDWMNSSQRGYGLWIWKPLILKHALMGTFGDYERIFYLDAGCQFSLETANAKNRFDRYLDLADLNGGFAFTHRDGQAGINDYSEEAWGNSALHNSLNVSADVRKSNQILAGCLILTRDSFDVVKTWMDWCAKDNYFFLKDPDVSSKQATNFIAHRHDQSILSILWKYSGMATIPDETWFEPDWNSVGRNFPIWTIRNSSSISSPVGSVTTKLSQKIQVSYSRIFDKVNRF